MQQDAVQCLQLLLSREEEAVIREAAFDSLQALDRLQLVASSPMTPLGVVKSKVQNQKFLTVE